MKFRYFLTRAIPVPVILALSYTGSALALDEISDKFRERFSSKPCTVTKSVNETIYSGDVRSQVEMADPSCVIDNTYVPVGKKRSYSIKKIHSHEGDYFRFELKGPKDNTLSKNRGRAELSNCFADENNILKNVATKQDFKFLAKTKDVYRYCENQQKAGTSAWYSFTFRLPENYDKLKSVIAQWHGTNDRLLYKDAEGNIQQLKDRKIDAYNQVIKAGGLFEQGGYPPLALKVSDNSIYLAARNDPDVYTNKLDRCNIKALSVTGLPTETEHHCLDEDKSVTILYSREIQPSSGTDPNKLKANEWITFTMQVKFSTYDNNLNNGNVDITPGFVRLWVASDPLNQPEPDTDWRGMLGKNDESGVYFKFGLYRVGGNGEPTEMHFKNVRKFDSLNELLAESSP